MWSSFTIGSIVIIEISSLGYYFFYFVKLTLKRGSVVTDGGHAGTWVEKTKGWWFYHEASLTRVEYWSCIIYVSLCMSHGFTNPTTISIAKAIDITKFVSI